MEYCGEVVSDKVAQSRVQVYEEVGKDICILSPFLQTHFMNFSLLACESCNDIFLSVIMMSVKHIKLYQWDKDLTPCAGLKEKYIISLHGSEFIDATRKGSLARYINHSW